MTNAQENSNPLAVQSKKAMKALDTLMAECSELGMDKEARALGLALEALYNLTVQRVLAKVIQDEGLTLDQLDKDYLELFIKSNPAKQELMLNLVQEAALKTRRH